MMSPAPSSSRPSPWAPLLVPLGVILMLLEEYVWHGLRRLMAWLGRLASIARIEAMIVALPPGAIALVFFVPVGLALPVKLAAVWAIATGHVVVGLVVLVLAKLAATALYARLYTLCKPALMTFGWFVRIHDLLTRAKTWAHARLEAWGVWQRARQVIAVLRGRLGSIFG